MLDAYMLPCGFDPDRRQYPSGVPCLAVVCEISPAFNLPSRAIAQGLELKYIYDSSISPYYVGTVINIFEFESLWLSPVLSGIDNKPTIKQYLYTQLFIYSRWIYRCTGRNQRILGGASNVRPFVLEDTFPTLHKVSDRRPLHVRTNSQCHTYRAEQRSQAGRNTRILVNQKWDSKLFYWYIIIRKEITVRHPLIKYH